MATVTAVVAVAAVAAMAVNCEVCLGLAVMCFESGVECDVFIVAVGALIRKILVP